MPFIGGFYFDSHTTFFSFDLFFRLGQKYKNIIQKYFLSFFGANENFKICFRDLLTFKYHLKKALYIPMILRIFFLDFQMIERIDSIF